MIRFSSAPEHAEQPPIPKHLWKVAALSGMASYLDAALIVSIAVNLAIYRDHYDMGVWMAGAISAIVTGCIAVGSLVGGRLADMFGRRRVYNLDILCYAVGAIVITLAPNDIVLFVGVLVAGLAAGADLPTSLAVVSTPHPRTAGRVSCRSPRSCGCWASSSSSSSATSCRTPAWSARGSSPAI